MANVSASLRSYLQNQSQRFLDALQRLAEQWPDALVSDIGLPGRDGFTLIHEIRRLEMEGRPKLRAIALTAFARAQDRVATLAAGFDGHCAKPMHPAELVAAILGESGQAAAPSQAAPSGAG